MPLPHIFPQTSHEQNLRENIDANCRLFAPVTQSIAVLLYTTRCDGGRGPSRATKVEADLKRVRQTNPSGKRAKMLTTLGVLLVAKVK